MVYVANDGTVCQTQPWGLDRLTKLFYGFVSFIVLFFQTMVGLDSSSSNRNGSSRTSGGTFRSGGGGGGGGRPFGPGGGGGGPKRFMTMKDVNPPTMGGGCPGGSCGM